MRFQLLGPVAASLDGGPVELGRRQERLLLGFLLLEPGRPVPLPRLAELLWPDEPPPGARKAVQTYAARLRSHLRPAGPEIVTDGGGYRVDADPGDVDAHEFLGLLERARATAGDERAALLDRGLALWRGPLLGDACPALVRERVGVRWEQARLAALTERAADLLGRGDPEAAVALLAGPALDRSAPEPLVALLMRAYTAAGRPAEALAAYERTRQRLRQDLGVHPGRSLVDERDRARRGPVRTPAKPLPRREEPAVPHELPAAPVGFVGRERELARLAAMLRTATDRPVAVALYGPGGVGKSALAVAAARQCAAFYPDGQLYVDLCGSTPGVPSLTALDAAGQALRSLGVPAGEIPRTAAEAAARLRSRLAGARLLLLLDNADDAAVPRALLPAAPGCALLVTSRSRPTTVDTDLDLAVDALHPADARSLLFQHAGRVSNSRAVDRVAELCDYLPLALRVAAARLADRTGVGFAEFADRLTDQRQRLDQLDVQGLAVRSSIGVSYDALRGGDDPLDRRAGDVFVRLGVLPAAEFSAEYAAALLGSPDVPGARRALARLAAVHLVRTAGPRYGLHDLVRLYALERVPVDLTGPEREGAIERVLAHYRSGATRLAQVVTPGRTLSRTEWADRPTAPPDPIVTIGEAMGWLQRTVPALLAVAEQVCGPAAPPERALFPLVMCRVLYQPLLKRSEWTVAHRLAVLAAAGLPRQPDPVDLADALRLLGGTEIHLNDEAGAAVHLTGALAAARVAGDVGRQISTLSDLGLVATRQGAYERALEHTLEALELARGHDDRRATGTTLLNLSSLYASLADWKRAQQALEESLAIRRGYTDLAGLAVVLPALGSAHFLQDHLDDAYAACAEGLQVCQEVGNTVDGWFAAFGLALIRLVRGDVRGALHDTRTAWAFCGQSRPHETAATLRLVALVLRRAGHPVLATRWDRRADRAYAELTGPVEEQIEAMLARGSRLVAGAAGDLGGLTRST